MNARILATTFALTLTVFAGASAKADAGTTELAWQQPGYVMEVVIATAARPAATSDATDTTLAWQEPGYMQEVVVATASRKEALKALLWIERPGLPERRLFLGLPAR